MATAVTAQTEMQDLNNEMSVDEIELNDLLTEMLDAYVGRICSHAVQKAESSKRKVVTVVQIDDLMRKAGFRVRYDFGVSVDETMKDMWKPDNSLVLFLHGTGEVTIELR